MKIIGLTGGIASGKSTVTETLQRLGAYIIDTDKVAHDCMKPGASAWKKLVDTFGKEILKQNQEIDRKYLGKIVFNQPEKLKQLDALMHPVVLEETRRRVQEIAEKEPDSVIVEEIPLLYEIHLEEKQHFDEIWVVWVDRECQIERLMHRDQCSRKEAEQRLAAQMPLDEKAGRAQRVIDNMGSREHAVEQTEQYFVLFQK